MFFPHYVVAQEQKKESCLSIEKYRINRIKLNGRKMAEYMVWVKVNVKGYEDGDMAVGAVLWGITCTVKGKRTHLWRSWTGKKPEGAKGLVGYRLYSTFLRSHTHHSSGERHHFYSTSWEALTHSFTHNKHVTWTYKSNVWLTSTHKEHEKWHNVLRLNDQSSHRMQPSL